MIFAKWMKYFIYKHKSNETSQQNLCYTFISIYLPKRVHTHSKCAPIRYVRNPITSWKSLCMCTLSHAFWRDLSQKFSTTALKRATDR